MKNMPVLFVGHGSPQNMLLENSFTRRLREFSKELTRPKAILVISAHWLTPGTCVTGSQRPPLIYDFYGFAPELYSIKYPCPGAPQWAKRVQQILAPAANVSVDYSQGLDHAVYSVLMHLYPNADVPVLEMSLDSSLTAQQHYNLAKNLEPLREEGVLIVASGNLVHNLAQIDFQMDVTPFTWAQEIDRLFKQKLEENDHPFFVNFPNSGKPATLAMPTPDHYWPVLYALALRQPNDPLGFIYEEIQNGSIAMRSFCVGRSISLRTV